MTIERVKLFVLAITPLVLFGVGDAIEFARAAGVWQNNRLVLPEMVKSAGGYAVGIGIYYFAVRYLNLLGIEAAELQTIAWFLLTLIGVALLSGQFFKWARLDQAIALLLIAEVGWLLWRNGG